MQTSISFVLDGNIVSVDFSPQSGLSPTTTVLNYLRSLHAHRGVKEGCAEGDCGACSVVLAELDGAPLRYKAVDSCLLFLPMLHGRQLITVENLRTPGGSLHPVQQAMIDAYGSQCGFCTPGMIMSLFALYKNSSHPSESEIRKDLAGNLCRCTGYRSIIEAARNSCTHGPTDHFTEDEPRIIRLLNTIRRESIDLWTERQRYALPATLREALEIRKGHPGAVLLNGATDAALRVTKKHELIPMILDLSDIPELRVISEEQNHMKIGSGVLMQDLLTFSRDRFPAFASMLDVFGSRQIRNLATIGGNIGTASPVGDTLPVLIAHEAEIVLTSLRGERRIPASEFAVGYRQTACAPDELITAIIIPWIPGDTQIAWYKISKRRDVDIATVSGGFRLELDDRNRVKKIILAYGGMADRTRRAQRTEAFLAGKTWDRSTVEEAMQVVGNDFAPISDARGSATMRQIAARNLLVKFWVDTDNEQTNTSRKR